jgi:hypothetical protein
MAITAVARRVSTDLREDVVRGRPDNVDVAAGIIYGVHILGLSSPNTHGIKGVSGSDYTIEGMAKARPLYEGVDVYKNHPARSDPDVERPIEEKIGWLENIQLREGGLYGDLHLLLSDPAAAKILESAQKKPDLFAMSHNARGGGEVRAGRYVIDEIPRVRSVDLVTDGATVGSLFESRKKHVMAITLRSVLEGASKFSAKQRLQLLEAGEAAGGMDDEGSDWKKHLVEAIGKLCEDGSEDAHGQAKKILGLLKPKAAETQEDDSSEEDKKKSAEAEAAQKKAAMESAAASAAGGTPVLEKPEQVKERCKGLCDLAGVKPDADLLESLCEMKTDGSRIKLLASVKKQIPLQESRTGPRSQGPAPTVNGTNRSKSWLN